MVPIVHSQDAYFSQFNANRLEMNPAWAGVEEDIRRVFLNYRNQYPGLGNTYVTYSASYDQYMEQAHGGLGFRIMNDRQGEGALSEFAISGIYAYHLKVTRQLSFNAGFEASFVQRSLDGSGFIFSDMIDPVTGQIVEGNEQYGKNKTDFPDFKIGFTTFYKNFYGGVSMAHLFKPNRSLSSDPNGRLPRKLVVHAGSMIPVYERKLGRQVLVLSPNVVYIQQQSLNQLNYGMEAIVKDQFIAGIWARQNLGINFSSIIFSAGYVTKDFRIRYSYDQQLSSPTVRLPVLGAHELSLILTLSSEKKIKRQAIKCPKI